MAKYKKKAKRVAKSTGKKALKTIKANKKGLIKAGKVGLKKGIKSGSAKKGALAALKGVAKVAAGIDPAKGKSTRKIAQSIANKALQKAIR